jgi:addiction module RelE/StbE family toxin
MERIVKIMKIIYSKQAKEQLTNIKDYIAKDNKTVAIRYLSKIKHKIEILEDYPYIGKVNTTMNTRSIRDFVVFGYKIIYKINIKTITILAIYKYIDFDENTIMENK